MAPAPRLLLFDVNETLSDLSSLAPRFAEGGAPPELLPVWFAGVLRDGFALTATGATADFATLARDGLRALLESTDGWRGDSAQAAERVLSGLTSVRVHPDAAEGLPVLHAAGYRLATLTNGSAATTEAVLGSAGLLDLFEAHLDVGTPGSWKPAAASYRYACQELDSPPERTVLVSVHPWDLHGARRAGLGTAWIHRGSDRYPTAMDRADHEARTLVLLAGSLCP
ncbi:haloacid dehalogenase type II [Actinacidiphila acidipaludis]|uniref:Haloacid dehalogenase type II n=1 Tax=Actinacidiphila acidipaludis TaxID=2873382 RepID=A0ABS7QMF7_9ACTN|nr:haloacid dehalogenase type II [Streptomyces acidipaludis]MBY8883052.1 haloacid dehalogenase type II [Streptomyces acidipaludis]